MVSFVTLLQVTRMRRNMSLPLALSPSLYHLSRSVVTLYWLECAETFPIAVLIVCVERCSLKKAKTKKKMETKKWSISDMAVEVVRSGF